ncbi:MAG: EH signature domain-containing protein [Rhodospirillaceae bacterium]
MSFRQLVEGLPGAWKPRRFEFPEVCASEDARIAVENRLGILSAPPLTIDMPELRECLMAAAESGDWSGISERNWRYASECLSAGAHPLIADERFITAYLAHAELSRSNAIVNGLIRYYLWHFEPARPGFRHIAAFLAELADRGHSRWSELHRRFRLFEPDRVPGKLAEAVMVADKPPREFLARIGLSGQLASSELLANTFVRACDGIVQQSLAEGGTASLPSGYVQRLVSWSHKGHDFLYGGVARARAALAEALLLPWITRIAPQEQRDFVKRTLLALLKEPRTNPVAWVDVSEMAQGVMCRWLAKVSLEQFLEVVDETVRLHHTRMWSSRRRFWNAYYEKGFIQEAWVVFGRRGAAVARNTSGTRERTDIVSFGSFQGSATSDQRQAVLIMKIGMLVVADWSHNGCCHVWLAGNTAAPRLFQREYYRSDLIIDSDFEKPHIKGWQSDIHDFIRAHTGFWMAAADYGDETTAK